MQAPGIVEFFHYPTKTSQMKNLKDNPGIPLTAKSLPLVSLVLPFELKMNKQASLTKMLTLAADEEEKKLGAEYPKELVVPVIKKLRHLIEGIPCGKENMSMCLVVSALSEKVYYFSPTNKLSNYFPDSVIEGS